MMKKQTPYGIEISDDCATCPGREGSFFCQMTKETLAEFRRIKFASLYPTGAVLFMEGQEPRGVHMLCKGRVKLTMTSLTGKAVIARVVEAGDLLGLHAVLLAHPHEGTAETIQPCQVDFMRRDDFINLVQKYAEASISAMRQISRGYFEVCNQVRYLGLTSSAADKLAAFLLESAVHGRETPEGIRFNLTLSHEGIAQVVTRALKELRAKNLICMKGPSVLIVNKPALAAMVAT
jgi:CRP/FNR family transcriptional regulator, cyclic AMP receptor protein